MFNRYLISAAHMTLPLPCFVLVTNLENGRKLVIRVNDRGPFVEGRIIDLSEKAAKVLGLHKSGLARVKVRYLRKISEQLIQKLLNIKGSMKEKCKIVTQNKTVQKARDMSNFL
ncbi:septal ring lytic transglycosylase RlpA family protein [Wolbachia endosymbiont of Atemnus politus]|uniref:septal ring lytic transglycosylase RlpA family protein n=1 Tax=Wolbachia endosymbiont of Atemnus politus TaxID=2682840 RepID=UPI0034E2D057